MGKKSKPGQAGATSKKPVKLTSGLKLQDLAVAAKKPEHNAFKDLRELYKRASEALTTFVEPGRLLVEGGYMPLLTPEENQRAKSLCSLLKRDVTQYSEQLGKLKLQADQVEKEGEFFDAFNLGNQYVMLIDSMTATMVPISQDISSLISTVDARKGKGNV